MDNRDQLLKKLLEKLELLTQRQAAFSDEINELRQAIADLEASEATVDDRDVEDIPLEVDREPVEEPQRVIEEHPADPDNVQSSESTSTKSGKSKKFRRSTSGKMIGGVCSGMAEYLGMKVWLTRLVWTLFSLFFCIGFIAYLLFWMLVPAEGRPVSVQSRPVPESEPGPKPGQVKAEQKAAAAPGHMRKEPSFNLEKYVGESLIGKIGIVILIIGVGIGAKYSIDNNLISPLIRIFLGYIIGGLLLFSAWRLRRRHENFSATLLSGGMAILYFMTFAAYSFYNLLPQWAAFLLMVIITVATVYSALKFNKQIIAIIGLVGAYCVPFLLSEGEGRPLVLFSYMSIINLGILFIAFRKYWKPLYLFSFGMTWLIFMTWYMNSFDYELYNTLTWSFLFVFFLIFYSTFLAYKLIKKEPFNVLDVVLLLINSFLFYGLGYELVERSPEWSSYLGIFTLFNAFLHALASYIVHRNGKADKSIFYLVAGLVLVFLTISIPVQLDGNWVTLLWMGEATLLFWIGRSKNVPLYEYLAYPVILLSFLSLAQDWSEVANASGRLSGTNQYAPFFNAVFLTSLLCSVALGYINYLFYSKPHTVSRLSDKSLERLVSIGITGVFLFVLYMGFAVEISNYWDQMFAVNAQKESADVTTYWQKSYLSDIRSFKVIWLLIYSMLFVSALCFLNSYRFKKRLPGVVSLSLNTIVLFLFLTTGLFHLSELRESFLDNVQLPDGLTWDFRLGIRYLSLAFVALLIVISLKSLKKEFSDLKTQVAFDVILGTTVLWVLTSELLHWLDLLGVSNSYKLWVSILWGVYALAEIGLGIWKKKKHLRIGAIALFSLTLVKLFAYDIAHLNTLSKTIVFVVLGVILLITSFLYNRYKKDISGE